MYTVLRALISADCNTQATNTYALTKIKICALDITKRPELVYNLVDGVSPAKLTNIQ